MGGMDVLISRAGMGVVLKAPAMNHSALFCACCKQGNSLLGVEQHQKSQIHMYKMRPSQMGTSNLSISTGAMNVNGCRG